MNTIDIFMYTLIAIGAVIFAGWFVATALEARRKRELHRQIEEGEVPVDYSAAIKEVATDQNNAILGVGFEHESRAKDLYGLRMKVAHIRANGYDRAADDVRNNIDFVFGIGNNPHPQGSGEAKQWARGYCQLTGTQPKEWMQRA
ncbi:MAG: hypothetical protein V3W44_04985 [Dehalococcoidales bacterium]